MRAPESKSYIGSFALGQPITNSGVARVLKSDNLKLKEGDIVVGTLPAEEYSAVSKELFNQSLTKLENPHDLDSKLFLGVLGMPGLTAYSSFYEIGQPKKGETIFISLASEGVEQLVSQSANLEGLTLVGSVCTDERLKSIQNEVNFDEGFNYRKKTQGRL